MMRTRTALLLSSLLWVFPYVLLGVAGVLWLSERGWSIYWLILAAVSMFTGQILYRIRSRRARHEVRDTAEVSPSPLWTPAGERAWSEVQKLAVDPNISASQINRPDQLWELLNRILKIVAREFHPRSSKPELEVPLPRVLLVVELVARDLKQLLKSKIPGSHLMTLHDLQRMQSLAQWAPLASLVYRMAMFAANPASGLIREFGSYAQGELLQESKLDLQQWLLQLAIKKAGYYAIELYSGHLELREFESGELTSKETAKDAEEAEASAALAKAEPLRVLVLGQVKAGKSSLINELFGELRAADDVVPRTRSLTPHLLKQDDDWSALIFDSAGYSEGSSDAETLKDISQEAAKADLLIWVCSAVSPARESDRRLMNDLRKTLEANPDREFPPVLVVVTHIDLLRPVREWSPPYDLRDESQEKSRNITAAVKAVSSDLRVPLERVIPACLKPGETYNVQEGIQAAMLAILPAARRLQCQRCLRESHSSEKWQLLWNQTREAGRVLLNLIQRKSDSPPH